MRDNKFIAASAGFIFVCSGLAMALCLTGGPGPQLEPGPYRAVGRTLARQSLALLKPGGSITVITRDTATFQNPATDVLLLAFRAELDNAHAKIDSVQTLQIDPLRPAAVPSGDFAQWIKHASKGSVIVSLMGPPTLSELERTQVGEIKPAIVAFCSGPVLEQVDLRALFSQGLLHAAVVSKAAGLCKSSRSSSEREIFDSRFIEVTGANLAALSAVSNTSP
jgi:hypothetical protein